MNTLKTKLKDPDWCEHFRAYLAERFAAENLSFLLAVEQFRETATANDADKARSQASDIVAQYLEPDAPFELNVSFQSKMSCKEAIEELPAGEVPDARIFDDTQVSVILLIMDYYKDFCSDQAHLTALKDVCDTPQPRAQRETPSEDQVRADEPAEEEEAGCLRVLTNMIRGR